MDRMQPNSRYVVFSVPGWIAIYASSPDDAYQAFDSQRAELKGVEVYLLDRVAGRIIETSFDIPSGDYSMVAILRKVERLRHRNYKMGLTSDDISELLDMTTAAAQRAQQYEEAFEQFLKYVEDEKRKIK